MRSLARLFLLVFVFTIPWEYSLDFGAPLGNVARIAGAVLLLIAVPAILAQGRLRTRGSLPILASLLVLWTCATYFWSIDPATTLSRLPGYLQEVVIVWLVSEFAVTADELRDVFRAWLAGNWVLASLTIVSYLTASATAQIRFVAEGQDPNDSARFLCLGLPVAAWLADRESQRWTRAAAFLYLPMGLTAILLTASRGGFLEALVALAGCGILLRYRHPRVVAGALLGSPLAAVLVWMLLPPGTLARLATIAQQAQGGDLNQRVNIWEAGWSAFQQAPLAGHGAGSFVYAAGLAPIDTAHNTALSVMVEGGLVGLALGLAIIASAVAAARAVRGTLRIALLTLLAVWAVASIVGTTGESRTTWLLMAVIAAAAPIYVGPSQASIATAMANGAWAAQEDL